MAGFARFDPRAFLERERRAAGVDGAGTSKVDRTLTNNRETLATFATLAAPPVENEYRDIESVYKTDNLPRHRENRKYGPSPAKAAKVAKAGPLSAALENPWDDAAEERAAIIEYDGGVPRVWAEALARLDPAHPPCDVPPARWVQFIDDCGRFLDEGWAPCAIRLGWGPFDLFGCDRNKPFARIDRKGLLWLLNGRKLLVLAANAAAISTRSGGWLTFRRCLDVRGRVLAWELAS